VPGAVRCCRLCHLAPSSCQGCARAEMPFHPRGATDDRRATGSYGFRGLTPIGASSKPGSRCWTDGPSRVGTESDNGASPTTPCRKDCRCIRFAVWAHCGIARCGSGHRRQPPSRCPVQDRRWLRTRSQGSASASAHGPRETLTAERLARRQDKAAAPTLSDTLAHRALRASRQLRASLALRTSRSTARTDTRHFRIASRKQA
jgi:hypothetical protein